MRSKFYMAASLLLASSVYAQQTASPQSQPAGAGGPKTAAPAQVAGQPAAPQVAAPTAGQGVVNLLEVAKQNANSPAAEKIPAVQATPAEAQAIMLADGHGQPIDSAKAKLQAAAAAKQPSILLNRLSFIGDDVRAILWVKGQNRTVIRGSTVLKYTVSEIREDGVCLAHKKSEQESVEKPTKKNKAIRQNDQCPVFVTFAQGVD